MLCELLRDARERANLTQTQVAALLGANQSTVSKYESGERRVDLIELVWICEALDVNVVELVSDYTALLAEHRAGRRRARV